MVPNTLKHDTIVRQLGSGGMGEVYLARDTKLDRSIALKVLPASMAGDPSGAIASSARPRPSPRSTTRTSSRCIRSSRRTRFTSSRWSSWRGAPWRRSSRAGGSRSRPS